MTGFTADKTASFCYNGKLIELVPDNMERGADGSYYTVLEDGLRAGFTITRVTWGAAEWTLGFEHTGSGNSGRISDIYGLDIDLPAGGEDAVWRGLLGDSCDGDSFMPVEKRLGEGEEHYVTPSGGRPSNTTAFPFFDIAYGSAGLVCGLGWSGQWHMKLSRNGGFVNIKAGQRDCDFYLHPGERARSVRVFLLSGEGDIGALRHRFRRALREHYSPRTYLGDALAPPLSVQDFDRYYWHAPEYRTEGGQLKIIKSAARVGHIDTFWIDAVWFREGFPTGVGNYDFAPGFPDGLTNISNLAHQNGMRLMVWFEPERVHTGSDLYKAHGDGDGWLLNIGGENRLFNLGCPEAREWLFDTLASFIETYNIDIYRQDFNIDPLPYWERYDEEGRRGLCEMRYIEGHYRLWDALIERFPHLLIDNCSSGGRRIDLETCARSLPCWRSDTACAPNTEERPVGTWHQNQTVNLSRYLPYHLASSWFEQAYEFRSGMTMGIACGFDMMREDYDPAVAIAATGELVRLRDYWQGDFYELSAPTCDEDVWFAYQLKRGGEGFAVIFRRRLSEQRSKIIKLRGLDTGADYDVTLYDEHYNASSRVYSGAELTDGIEIHIPERPGSAVLEYKERK